MFKDVGLSGGTCAADPYFARTPTCTSYVTVDVDWGDLDAGNRNVPANFAITIEGQALTPPADGNAYGIWTRATPVLTNAVSGANAINLSYSWKDENTTHGPWRGNVCKVGNSPCELTGTSVVHRTFVGDSLNAGTVELIRTSGAAQGPDQEPGGALAGTPAPDTLQTAITVYPTIGLRSSLRAGQRHVLRADAAQGNQSLDCEPTGGQGHDFQMFLYGCTPHYGTNTYLDPIWWNPATKQCPTQVTIFNQPNSSSEFWQCVPAAPGFSPPVIAGGIAARTGNCIDSNLYAPNKNSCSKTACVHPSEYAQWLAGTSSDQSRLVDLFIVPYGAFKGVNAGDGIPLADYARFYVTGWGGHGQDADPCPGDEAAQPGEIVGYFVEFIDPDPGPVDLTATCVIGQLRPCRAVLVR